jgi:hypothetical protein
MIPGSGRARHRGGRAVVIIVAILAAAGVAALAWFSEPLGMMFKLRTWDKDAPVKVVREFLTAAEKHDQAAADRLLEVKTLQPLTKNGKWIGYRQPLPITGFSNFRISEIVPKQFPAHPRVEFMTMGEGAADVWVPGADGREGRYRLERRPKGWVLTELGGGRISAK